MGSFFGQNALHIDLGSHRYHFSFSCLRSLPFHVCRCKYHIFLIDLLIHYFHRFYKLMLEHGESKIQHSHIG